MSQGFRDLLSNRKFAIPLIALLALCFVGLLLLGIAFILPALKGGKVAQATATPAASATQMPTSTPVPTNTPTPKPSPTPVIVYTFTPAPTGQPTAAVGATASPTSPGTAPATTQPTSAASPTVTPTPTSQAEEGELAQTGVGWGLILFSGLGLVLLAFVARRLRLAG